MCLTNSARRRSIPAAAGESPRGDDCYRSQYREPSRHPSLVDCKAEVVARYRGNSRFAEDAITPKRAGRTQNFGNMEPHLERRRRATELRFRRRVPRQGARCQLSHLLTA